MNNYKVKNLILLTSFFLIGSQVIISQAKTVNLPIIDFSKQYPKKEIILQDIADLEYVPLETTDDVLLSDKDVFACISDKYILVYSPQRGDIFVFDRAGKIYAHFNHKGQSGREYIVITGVILDEINEEIFVCSQNIQIYSLRGEYKRTLNINTVLNEKKVYDFDDNTLLVYDDILVDQPERLRAMGYKYNVNPYSLISKKDGSLISILEINLPQRYSNRSYVPLENNMYTINILYYNYSINYGRDFVIADKSSDTLYLLSHDRELSPLLIRRPSVHTSEPRRIWYTVLTTHKFMLISNLTLTNNSGSKVGRTPSYLYEFETGGINDVSILDAEICNDFNITRNWSPFNSPATFTKNMTAELIQAPTLINSLKKKRLKGNVEKLAMALDKEDNPVVRIIKFK